jgi:hypothetical protein
MLFGAILSISCFPVLQQMFKKICDRTLILTLRATEGIILEAMDGVLNNQDMGILGKMAMNLADMAHDDEVPQVGDQISCIWQVLFLMNA